MLASENGLLMATVLLNVQGRDVGGFVEDAKAAVGREVALPAGYYVAWSGRWENQEHARQRSVVVPIVLMVIFALLYWTYGSASKPPSPPRRALCPDGRPLFALGSWLQLLVAVGWVSSRSSAPPYRPPSSWSSTWTRRSERRRQSLGGRLTREALREAVIEGALLRLRPKVMTVSTVVAGLLPIMWSTSVGAEVMKPLATPVLGGMVSSLLHVLVVTPVIFFGFASANWRAWRETR